MIVYDDKTLLARKVIQKSEIELFGRAVSRGAAVGKVVCLYGRQRQFYLVRLRKNQIEDETRRFRRAVRLAKKQIEQLGSSQNSDNAAKAQIFDSHFLMLEDELFLRRIEEYIDGQKVNAEWAVKTVSDAFVAEYKSIVDEHLRERYIDFEDVSERLLSALGGAEKSDVLFGENAVIVAADLKPSTLIEITRNNPLAIVTERGGWTSHTFILAREMNLPAVTGVAEVLRHVETGDEIIVDAYSGRVAVRPTVETHRKFKIAAKRFQVDKKESFRIGAGRLKTLDGREIRVRANVDSPPGYARAKRLGARGVGLYRSEFLFNREQGFPSEAQQIAAYRKIAEAVGETERVSIRTFDLNLGNLRRGEFEKEQNLALGLRGIRFGLAQPEQFRVQLSALLQASAKENSAGNIDIVLPLISDVSEVTRAKKILAEEKLSLEKRGIAVGNPRLGAMFEVPSAVFTAREIAREIDFLNLGTNDLVQYLLAVDRDNPAVADWFRTLHPAVLRAVQMVLEAAKSAEIPAIVCGEMAGSPFYAPVLIGLGATELSMNVNSIARVGRVVAGIAFEEAHELTAKLEICGGADETESVVRNYFLENWSHLISPDILPPEK